MKRIVVTLVLCAALWPATQARAADTPLRFASMLRAISAHTTLPPEWAGIWVGQDSTYDCDGTPMGSDATTDTLCAGQGLATGSGPEGISFDCSGTVTATDMDVTCTGTNEVFPNCNATITVHMVGTRTGDSQISVTTAETSYAGSGDGCNLFPGSCFRIVSRTTRTGPAPGAYCATSARQGTWGALKVMYR